MFWTFSFQLLPDEKIIEDSTQKQPAGIKPAYSVFLTNKRAIFRFDGFGSSLTQSFYYDEIVEVSPCKRMFVSYIQVKTKKRDFFLNTSEVDYWSDKILRMKETQRGSSEVPKQTKPLLPEREKKELLYMLNKLKRNSLLTDKELEEKVALLNSMER